MVCIDVIYYLWELEVYLQGSPAHHMSLFLTLVHLFPLTSLSLTHSVLLAFPDLPPSCSLPPACPLSQLLWPLNITQAVSAKLWMSLDTYSTQTPFGISICTEPISIFIAGRVGDRLKPAVRISQSWRHRNKCPKQNYVSSCIYVSVCVCVFCLFPWKGGSLNHGGNLNPPFGNSTIWTNYPSSC